MENSHSQVISSGLAQLDTLLQGLRVGDNVVWQVDRMDEYSNFAGLFAAQAIQNGAVCVYFRFAPHLPVVKSIPGIITVEVEPSPGFDYFSGKVHEIIEAQGRGAYFIFDNLSSLVTEWATDELLANFYQVTCPYIFEQDDMAYFALTRSQHNYNTIARIRDTTQILIDIYHIDDNTYIHPLKVWNRYSQQMFLPHLAGDREWTPIFRSGDAATVLSASRKQLVRTLPDSSAPWNSVYHKLAQYQDRITEIPGQDFEVAVLKKELTRMMLGNHAKLNEIADHYLTVDDLFQIRNRLIGTGQIGGKAAGMLLARRVLLAQKGEIDFSTILEEHDSFYIGADVFFTFLVNNNLFRTRLNMAKNPQLSLEEFAEVEQAFLSGLFPRETLEQFHDMLDYFGQAPIIVRSSSLLEDSFTNAFAGKYRSEFCSNQGSPDERLESFLHAVKLVYASALNPDVLSYRRKFGLSEGDEQMAILVQRVSGMPYKKYFFPTLAGVAFSYNLFAWNNRIDPAKGMIRLVLGLGTRAVNRVSNDYPRMIAVSHPELRPETGNQIIKYSQRYIDLLDLSLNELTTKSFNEVMATGDYPNIELLVSSMTDGYLHDWSFLDKHGRGMVLTFNNIIKNSTLVKTMGDILSLLHKAWGQDIDIEFTAHINPRGMISINLLQCRALSLPKESTSGVAVPDTLDAQQILFQSKRAISAGAVAGIRHIIYIDPRGYSEIQSPDMKKTLGRIIGKLNDILCNRDGKFILVGPGRWGSNNIELGINVSYADISNTSILVEIAYEKNGYEPEVSFGTHFFLDLVEAGIIYIPVYPDEEPGNFNTAFFQNSHNVFQELLPGFNEYGNVVKVIDITLEAANVRAEAVVTPDTRRAICFLRGGYPNH
jgi:pyruvate,water dikinase